MRILNRPMFRYGGPIKEGIMHGMRNGGRAALVGNPVYPQTGGREHHQENIYVPKDYKAIEQAENIGQIYDAPFLDKQFRKNWYLDMKPHRVTDEPSQFQFQYTVPKKYLPKDKYRTRQDILTNPEAYDYYKKKYIEDEWRKKIDRQKEILTRGEDERVSGIYEYEVPKKVKVEEPTSRWDDTAPELTASQRDKLAKDQQNARLKKYLDMMGYDSAKKGALSKALIDASALVQDATTEAGSLKKADWGNLINKAIQTTSKRLEKPEQIREAVGLMMTKAAIEKEMNADQNQLNNDYKRMQIRLGEKSLAGTSFEEIVSDRMIKDDMLKGNDLAALFRIKKGIDAKVISTKDMDADQDALTYVTKLIEEKEGTPYPPGHYIIKDRIIKVDEQGKVNKVL